MGTGPVQLTATCYPTPPRARRRCCSCTRSLCFLHHLVEVEWYASRCFISDMATLSHACLSFVICIARHKTPLQPDRHGHSPGPAGSDSDRELWVLYSAVLELSEQLEKNRMVAVELGAQATRLRVRWPALTEVQALKFLQAQAGHAQAGFPLRRFNLNLSEGVYTLSN